MLLVLASRYDLTAGAWATRHGAALLTPANLSVAGWRYNAGISMPDIAVIGGEVIPVESIAGVLTRLPCVSPEELGHIVEPDREYVAAEMTAFLLAWLSRLGCPVINRPTPVCLCGPAWPRERWIWAAAQLGIRVRSVHRQARLDHSAAEAPRAEDDNRVVVTVVGNRWFGPADELLGRQALRLAAAAGVDLLTVQFDGAASHAAMVDADPWPDITAPEITDVVAAYLMQRGAC
jgi:hypothetical protein